MGYTPCELGYYPILLPLGTIQPLAGLTVATPLVLPPVYIGVCFWRIGKGPGKAISGALVLAGYAAASASSAVHVSYSESSTLAARPAADGIRWL